jgi:hypothetical protein
LVLTLVSIQLVRNGCIAESRMVKILERAETTGDVLNAPNGCLGKRYASNVTV